MSKLSRMTKLQEVSTTEKPDSPRLKLARDHVGNAKVAVREAKTEATRSWKVAAKIRKTNHDYEAYRRRRKQQMSEAEIVRRRSSDWPPSDWGGWKLDELELVYPAYPGGGVYPIDLRRFTTSAEMLDMIFQVAGKDWASDECVAGLVHALNHLLHPQGTLCGGGVSNKLTVQQIRKLVERGTL
jgi:hypothetical protein